MNLSSVALLATTITITFGSLIGAAPAHALEIATRSGVTSFDDPRSPAGKTTGVRYEPGTRVPASGDVDARMLVLLVEFPPDDDPDTTGDGRFETEPSNEYSINQPPHDQPYFDRQVQALQNYLTAASGGRYRLDWDLFPAGTGAIEMPEEMGYYNPDTTDAALDRRLAEFFRDAVEAADAAGAAFSDYEYVTIFHAGVGQDLLIDDTTPSDITSAYLSFDELREFLGEEADWPGISVQGGSHFVRDGLWLPETENQQGFEFAITGVFAQLFGSQLGLPILWNPDSGAPGIGRFGLMDQGGGNELGQAPALPSAWSRLDLGWAEAEVIAAGTDVAIRARGALESGGVDLVIVPIDEREYFLLEVRKKELDGDDAFTIEMEATVPINVRGGEYDYGIPGSGLLVWHIDQAVIDANRDDNRVNADFRQRGVKLIEADGLDQIGLFPEGGFGLPEDAFFADNNDAFTPDTEPSTESNYADAWTGIFVTDVSDTASVMTCTIASTATVSGWPQDEGRAHAVLPSLVLDVDGDDDLELLSVDDIGRVDIVGLVDGARSFEGRWLGDVVRMVGGDLLPRDGDELFVSALGGELGVFGADDAGVVTELTALSVTPSEEDAVAIAAADVDGDGTVELLAVVGSELRRWEYDGTEDEFVLSTATLVAGAPAVGIAAGDDLVVVSHGDGSVEVLMVLNDALQSIDADNLGGGLATPARLGVSAGSGGAYVLAALTSDRDVVARSVSDGGTLGPLPGWPRRIDSADGAVSLGDVDGDGRLDVVVGDLNRVWAFAANGTTLDGFPATLVPFLEDMPQAVTAEVVLADVDGSDGIELLVASPEGPLHLLGADGVPRTAWPRPLGGGSSVAPTLSGFAGGSAALSRPGSSWSYLLPLAELGAVTWSAGGGAGGAGFVSREQLGSPSTGGPFFSEERLVIYPNPAYDEATFRYEIGSAADVEVTIYDLTGQRVTAFSGPSVVGVPNEVRWPLTTDGGADVAPGLYIVRVTATGAGETVTHETKVAIAR